jgi:hypothetical protein
LNFSIVNSIGSPDYETNLRLLHPQQGMYGSQYIRYRDPESVRYIRENLFPDR